MKQLIDQLRLNKTLSKEAFFDLLTNLTESDREYLYAQAREVAQSVYGNKIFIRGLIEVSNYCKNDCFYCGIRNGNQNVERYRLHKADIMECCQEGYALGFRTFVLQGGEDLYYNDEIMCDIISTIRKRYPDCAITLSLGEKSKETYQKYYDAGANRYLLRHESSNASHYAKLHPKDMHLATRMQCLYDLKAIGFQCGSGVMVGSPFQKVEHLVEDILFLEKLQPAMIGIGPYLPHKDTPFHDQAKGSLTRTLDLLAILRLAHPSALIPSTTALATIAATGRQKGVLAGANVVMPNLSPLSHRKQYSLYNDKACMHAEAKEGLSILKEQMEQIGYQVVEERGDFKDV